MQDKFESLPLDDRLRKALAHLGWQYTTPVQAKAIPLALRGKDVLARARTGQRLNRSKYVPANTKLYVILLSGSGKTGAYAIPILQKILSSEVLESAKTALKRKGPCAIVLVPTRELVEQVRQVFCRVFQAWLLSN